MSWNCIKHIFEHTLDMNSGYWQLPVAEEDKEKTPFITKYGCLIFFECSLACQMRPLRSRGPWTWFCLVLAGWVLLFIWMMWMLSSRENFPWELGKPACRFVTVSEVWTEAEASKVCTCQAQDSISGSKSGWRWGAHHRWSCPCTCGVARTNTEEASGAVLGVCELPSGIHSGFGQDHCPSVWADGAEGKMEVGRRASQGIHWVEKGHGHSTSDGLP